MGGGGFAVGKRGRGARAGNGRTGNGTGGGFAKPVERSAASPGGEIGAAVIVEAVMRLLPGAVGNEASTQQESFTIDTKVRSSNGADSTCGSNGLLDYPHYTRPAEFRGIKVPEELMSGNHEEIRKWRRQRALEKTWRNRPDLLEGAALSEEDKKFLTRIRRDGIGKDRG